MPGRWTSSDLRNYLGIAFLALGFACFATLIALSLSYSASNPIRPNAGLGFVHPLNNHGKVVYLTDAQATGRGLLLVTFAVGVLVGGLMTPKEVHFVPPPAPPLEPGWTAARTRTVVPVAFRGQRMVFAASLIGSFILITLVSRYVVDLALSRGLVLAIG